MDVSTVFAIIVVGFCFMAAFMVLAAIMSNRP